MAILLRRLLLFILGCICVITTTAQVETPVRFEFIKKKTDSGEVRLQIKASLRPGIKLYAIQQISPDAVGSSVLFDSSFAKYFQGSITEDLAHHSEKDTLLKLMENYFIDSALWQQKIKVNPRDSFVLKGTVSYMYKENDTYKSGEEDFKFYINPSFVSGSAVHTGIVNQSLLWIFIAAFGGGLLALLTPCVYSMIPVTVSFFTKRSKTKAEGIRNAMYYAGSIVTIFTGLGFLVTLIFGPAALNNLATNWIANLIFFILFLVFGISFLGAFEITLPSSWMNKSDAKAGTGSFLGIFFMALTLALVSFSCTGPIIGNLLVLAAKGNKLGPLVGMFGFSLALAFPFALFAFFPSKLNVLGKAGGWLNTVKVTLGFLELALALKFLSNADLVKGWRILDREVFLCLWIVIFILLGIYLLGKLKFHHDDELPKNDFGVPFLSITRLMFAIAFLAFAVYLIPGLWGAPLKAVSAFVPPMGTQDFSYTANSQLPTANDIRSTANDSRPTIRYHEQMKLYEPEVVTRYGMTTYFDYDEALTIARKEKKPLMLDFTGINCVNCRKMEGQVWSNPEVMKKLKNDFVIVSLYVDVQNIDLPENEVYESPDLQKKVTTLGDKNADLQVKKYGSNSQPYYFFLDANENRLVADGYGYDPDVKKFITLLDQVLAYYKKSNPENSKFDHL